MKSRLDIKKGQTISNIYRKNQTYLSNYWLVYLGIAIQLLEPSTRSYHKTCLTC